MAKTTPLAKLLIRTAEVRVPDVGYILAADPKKEADEIPHAIAFRWKSGEFTRGDRGYNAHTACVIEQPEVGWVDASGPGYYSVTTFSGITGGEIFEDSQPPPRKKRTPSFRAIAAVSGKAYAVGLRGLVYRLDGLRQWTRIDDGLPDSFNIQAIHGFGPRDIYAVGRGGSLWHYNGKAWDEIELPTSVNLTSVKCAGDGRVYIGGHKGILIRGRNAAWEVVDHDAMSHDVWDIEWFARKVYVSTLRGVYRVDGDDLEPVDFGDDPPKSTYQLSAGKDVMWSNGELDIMSFDGKEWTRIV